MNTGEEGAEPILKAKGAAELPAASTISSTILSSSSVKSLIDLAWAEWEIVQQKIDNVSTFPFTVKTWTVALAAAFLGLGKGFEFPPRALYFVCVIPFLFWAVESKHHRVRGILGRRAGQLEALIASLAPITGSHFASEPSLIRTVGRIPGVALAIHRAKRDLERQFVTFDRPGGVSKSQWVVRNITLVWHKYFVRHADGIFYACILIIVTLVAAALSAQSQLKPVAAPKPPAPNSWGNNKIRKDARRPSPVVSVPTSPPAENPPDKSLDVNRDGVRLPVNEKSDSPSPP